MDPQPYFRIAQSQIPITVKKDLPSYCKKEIQNLPEVRYNRLLLNDYQAKFHGTDAHAWVIEMENNLNIAAGFKGDYRTFSRALFITWPGDPANPADYMEANVNSRIWGNAVVKLLMQLRRYSPSMQINIIGHSQGNGVMVSAVNKLAETTRYQINNMFCWQAALPNSVLRGIPKYFNRQPPSSMDQYLAESHANDPWFMPYIHDGVEHITVFFSGNDNIVGQITEQSDQKRGVSEQTVFNRKPIEEYLAAIITTYMGLGSLYLAGNALAFPASYLLKENLLDGYYKIWRSKRLSKEIILEDKTLPLLPTIEEQVALLKQQGLMAPVYQRIKYRMKHHQPQLKQKLNWLLLRAQAHGTISEYIIARLCDAITDYWLLYTADIISAETEQELQTQRLHQKVLDCFALLDKEYWGPKTTMETLLKGTAGGLITLGAFFNEMARDLLHILINKKMQDKLFTFVCCAEFSSNREKVKRGLGWSGIDEFTIDHWGKEIENVQTTQWIYFHSDMKIPSKDVMENIYQDKIWKKIKFGQYPKENQGEDDE
jgi:hypothetical protein